MPDWNAILLRAAGQKPGTWDVLDAGGAPAALCGNYETAEAAHAAIVTAGMSAIREAVIPPAFGPEHDLTSTLRFGRPGGRPAVIMVRRRPVMPPSCSAVTPCCRDPVIAAERHQGKTS